MIMALFHNRIIWLRLRFDFKLNFCERSSNFEVIDKVLNVC